MKKYKALEGLSPFKIRNGILEHRIPEITHIVTGGADNSRVYSMIESVMFVHEGHFDEIEQCLDIGSVYVLTYEDIEGKSGSGVKLAWAAIMKIF